MLLQLLLFLAAFLLVRLYSAAAFDQLAQVALVACCTLAAWDLFAYHIFPSATGATLIGPPPRILLRELGDAWISSVIWLPVIGVFLGHR